MADFLLQGIWVDGTIFTDAGSGAHEDLNVLYPVMPDDPSWYWVAQLAGGDPNDVSKKQLVVRPIPNSFGNPPISPGSTGSLQYIWGMLALHDNGGTLQLSQAAPPPGFFALSGFFGMHDDGSGNGLPGGMTRFAYIGNEMILSRAPASNQIWNDSGSGADDDGSVWAVEGSNWQASTWSCFVGQFGYGSPSTPTPLIDLSKIDFNI